MIKELHGGIGKKKGQATLMTQVACPFSSVYSIYFIEANKCPYGKRFLHRIMEEGIIVEIQQIIAMRLID
jgi:hypothetical protein